MRPQDLHKLLESVGAIRQGHFELSSGRHSATYVQCALVLQYPQHAEALGRALAAEFHDIQVDAVVSPAIGGIVLGQEVARAIGVRAIWVERGGDGRLGLRRGFELEKNERVLVIEDVWTTGGSTSETVRVVEQTGGRVVAAGALIDRSNGKLSLPVRTEALLEMRMESCTAAECPQCHSGGVAERPGSRHVPAGLRAH